MLMSFFFVCSVRDPIHHCLHPKDALLHLYTFSDDNRLILFQLVLTFEGIWSSH